MPETMEPATSSAQLAPSLSIPPAETQTAKDMPPPREPRWMYLTRPQTKAERGRRQVHLTVAMMVLCAVFLAVVKLCALPYLQNEPQPPAPEPAAPKPPPESPHQMLPGEDTPLPGEEADPFPEVEGEPWAWEPEIRRQDGFGHKTNMIVIARLNNEDIDWVDDYPGWSVAVFDDSPSATAKRTPGRIKHLAWLDFIIPRFFNLPNNIVFLDAASGPLNVSSLQLGRQFQLDGFANVRCDVPPECPGGIALSGSGVGDLERAFVRAWAGPGKLMGGFHKAPPLPVAVAAPSAEFVATVLNVRRRKDLDYARYRRWLWHAALEDEETADWVFDHMWPIINRLPAVHCPTTAECKCDLYAECPTSG